MRDALTKPQGWRFLGLDADALIKYFFGGNAIVAIVVLALITVFLFKEGFGFIEQNRRNIELYRKAGLEYVDILRKRMDAHATLGRQINDDRLHLFKDRLKRGETAEQINAALAPLDEFSTAYSDAAIDLRGLVSDLGEAASGIKQRALVAADAAGQRAALIHAGKSTEAEQVQVEQINFSQERQAITGTAPMFDEVAATLRTTLTSLVTKSSPGFDLLPEKDRAELKAETLAFLADLDKAKGELAAWNGDKPVSTWEGLSTFLTNPQWLTASFWQDWYGVMPLLAGSLFVGAIALIIAVPLGVSAAIYVNQIAGVRESSFIKPAIEFIAAFPSVVLGFFGVAVLGETIRVVSNMPALAWVPFFPISERLNATTAGILLGLMAVPTIFSLAEDAINNVPVHFKEASFALGASKLQTLIKITVPAALSGIIAAVLLGFGRVIGETMVVLLCAGNRIQIPDFTEGFGAIFQPVHTMTGIIAQEMGEVPQGSIHYRALFMVAIFLFLLALVINYGAQKIVKKFKISIG